MDNAEPHFGIGFAKTIIELFCLKILSYWYKIGFDNWFETIEVFWAILLLFFGKEKTYKNLEDLDNLFCCLSCFGLLEFCVSYFGELIFGAVQNEFAFETKFLDI